MASFHTPMSSVTSLTPMLCLPPSFWLWPRPACFSLRARVSADRALLLSAAEGHRPCRALDFALRGCDRGARAGGKGGTVGGGGPGAGAVGRERESAFLSPMLLKTMNETNRNVSRTAQSLAIPRDTRRVRIEWYGFRLGVDAPLLPQRARQPAVREPAGSVVGGTPPERPSR